MKIRACNRITCILLSILDKKGRQAGRRAGRMEGRKRVKKEEGKIGKNEALTFYLVFRKSK